MTSPIQLEAKGLTVEVWTTAKGEDQYRIKVTRDDHNVEAVGNTIAEVRNMLKNRFGIGSDCK